MILYSRHSATFRLVERHLAKLNAPLRDYIELGSMEAIKELVKMGLGVGVAARWVGPARGGRAIASVAAAARRAAAADVERRRPSRP